ncbi:hypothetical protein N9A28_06980 [Sulfurimonas sp.]|nr:hypothetical protein [Sulfurimonas sp.]
MQLNIAEFLKYKFFNSVFLGVSVGSIFVLYTPLMPSIYSIGGIFLALGMLLVAKLYYKILNIDYFFKISLLIELTLVLILVYFLIFSYSYTTALVIYIGYQLTFTFGSYLVRAETLFLKKPKPIELVDVAKQKGYLVGMFLSYIFYMFLESYFGIIDKELQVYYMHFILLALEIIIIYKLIHSFEKN